MGIKNENNIQGNVTFLRKYYSTMIYNDLKYYWKFNFCWFHSPWHCNACMMLHLSLKVRDADDKTTNQPSASAAVFQQDSLARPPSTENTYCISIKTNSRSQKIGGSFRLKALLADIFTGPPLYKQHSNYLFVIFLYLNSVSLGHRVSTGWFLRWVRFAWTVVIHSEQRIKCYSVRLQKCI